VSISRNQPSKWKLEPGSEEGGWKKHHKSWGQISLTWFSGYRYIEATKERDHILG
jgi:hypothetical protein